MLDPNPYAPPRLPSAPALALAVPRAAHVADGSLVLPPGHPLPALCIKCGTTESLEPLHHELRYRSGLLYLGLLLGLIPGLVLVFAATKRAPVVLPLCPTCGDRWRRAATIQRLTFVGGILALGVALFAAQVCFVTHSSVIAPILIFATAVAGLVLGERLRRRDMLTPTRIDDGAVTVRGVAPAVLRAVSDPATFPGWQDALSAFFHPTPVARPKKKRKKKSRPRAEERAPS